MLQLICHLVGDYWFQTDQMALNKKEKTRKGLLLCILYCVLYSLPFLILVHWTGVIAIAIGHFVMDRYHWLDHLIAWKNRVKDVDNFGFSPERPKMLALFLYIVHDNAFDLLWNYLIILLWTITLK